MVFLELLCQGFLVISTSEYWIKILNNDATSDTLLSDPKLQLRTPYSVLHHLPA